MRQDSSWTVYVIQHQQRSDKRWVDSNLDEFGYPTGFSVSHECWQQTGITGTFDQVVGNEGLRYLANKHPLTAFRLVRRQISQRTEVVAVAWYGDRYRSGRR